MDEIDEAARRLAITLMRLNEGLEFQDAEGYSTLPTKPQGSPRWHREKGLRHFYRDWFTRQARET